MLTEMQIKAIKTESKSRKYFDTDGLFLLATKAGGRLWRFRYWRDGKEKALSLGAWPAVSIKQARLERNNARMLLAKGIDPAEQRRSLKYKDERMAENTFKAIALEWFNSIRHTWVPSHAKQTISIFERDIYPWIGDRQINEISPPELLKVIRRIEKRGVSQVPRIALQKCGKIFRYAIATGRAERDPAADLKDALLPAKKVTHFPTFTDPEKVGRLLLDIDSYTGIYTVKAALQIAPMVFVRPGELRCAKWRDIDFDNAEWKYHIRKTDVDHMVPLSRQFLEILRDLHEYTGHCEYVFSGAYDNRKTFNNCALSYGLYRLGYDTQTEITPHGFRAMARTLLHERLEYEPAIIEHQLAHSVPDLLGKAYNRTKFIDQRRQMMQAWADYLDRLKEEARVARLDRKRDINRASAV